MRAVELLRVNPKGIGTSDPELLLISLMIDSNKEVPILMSYKLYLTSYILN